MSKLLENLNFNEHGLIPAIIIDADDDSLLTLCYMNGEALEKTLETKQVHVYRRSKGRLMLKGETSGHTQTVKEIRVDCHNNSIALKVEQKVAACAEGYKTCYFREYSPESDSIEVTEQRVFDPEDVY